MSSNYIIIEKCLLCGNKTYPILELGETALANEYPTYPTKQDVFPLTLTQCRDKVDCGHIQLNCIVDQKRLYQNYSYLSGTSFANHEYFRNYANQINEMFNLDDSTLIFEIGSNDGTLLEKFKEINLNHLIGIDPAENICEIANNKNIQTISEFFNESTANKLSRMWEFRNSAKIVIANNVFAHNSDLETIVKGIKKILRKDGAFVFEVNYAIDILEKGNLSTIYHEHLHYHMLKPLNYFFGKMNLSIFHSERVCGQGGNIRVFVKHKDSDISTIIKEGYNLDIENHLNTLKNENNIDDKIEQFKQIIETQKNNIHELFSLLKKENKSIAMFGAPAKITTMFSHLRMDQTIVKYVVEENALKINKLTPGTHIKIVGVEYMKNNPVDYMLIGAWNFADSIIENNKYFTGKWIIPMPNLKVIDEI